VGLFLLVLALTGLEHHQGFAVLGHPGFRHFVRLCVHPSGRVEASSSARTTRWARARRFSSITSPGTDAVTVPGRHYSHPLEMRRLMVDAIPEALATRPR
jgi:hypothetical protein